MKHTWLCSAHFEDDCYEHNKLVVDAIGQNSGLEIKSYIRRDAVPTRDTVFAASPEVLSKRAKRQVIALFDIFCGEINVRESKTRPLFVYPTLRHNST